MGCGRSANFEQRIVNPGFCYERAIGNLDGDGRNEIVAVAPQSSVTQGARGLVVFRGPDWKPEPLISFSDSDGTDKFWRCDDLIVAGINRDGRPDIVGAIGAEAGAAITRLAWWENPGKSAVAWKRHYVQAEVARERTTSRISRSRTRMVTDEWTKLPGPSRV